MIEARKPTGASYILTATRLALVVPALLIVSRPLEFVSLSLACSRLSMPAAASHGSSK